MKYLLDTNICIYIINHKPVAVFERFKQCRLGDVAISSITACELAFGVEKSASTRNRQALEQFLSPLEVVALDDEVMWHYGRIRQSLQRQGTPIGALDMLIASHAMRLDVVLVTNNTKEFQRVDGLRLENWLS